MKIDSSHKLRPASPRLSMAVDYVEGDLPQRAPPERLQKGSEFRISRNVQHICGPLQAMRRSGDIDDCHVAAANRWYRDYVLGVEGARDPEAFRSGKAGDAHTGMLARLAACERHSQVQRALGLCAELRLRLMLVDELSFSAMADKLMHNEVNGRKKVAAQMTFLLEQLVEHYRLLDQRRWRASLEEQ